MATWAQHQEMPSFPFWLQNNYIRLYVNNRHTSHSSMTHPYAGRLAECQNSIEEI
jgi:hypothetical protein